jgi:response regulator RpfG family c-di-GMP phosphodiesterase
MSESPITCLVVDDEAPLREAIGRVLLANGYECITAASGAEALDIMEKVEVPVVLSDIKMPVMDGVTLLGKIRDRWPDTAVLVVTAVAEVEVAVACLQMGALDYLTKPFQLNEVKARIEQAIEKRRLLLDNRMYQEHLSELVAVQARRIEELFLEGVQVLVEALEAKDAYTRGHSTRVSAYSGRIANELSLDADNQHYIKLAAELHDVGKIGVREAVLLKPARLDADEYDHLMQHMAIGARILDPLLKNAPQVIDIVRSHHEHYDGSGLPDSLAKDAIPLPARVVSLADAFDAMTSVRPYRAAMSPQAALEEIDRCTGRQFDPDVVGAFHSAFPEPSELPIETPDKVHHQLPEGVAAGQASSPQ